MNHQLHGRRNRNEALQKDSKAVSKALLNLTQNIEKMQKEVDTHVQPAKKPKVKAVKKTPAKKVLVRKTAPATAADKIFVIIQKSKKGINTEALMKKTGYERKSISNVIYKLTKQGKIKTVAKGVYVKA